MSFSCIGWIGWKYWEAYTKGGSLSSYFICLARLGFAVKVYFYLARLQDHCQGLFNA